MNRVSTPEGQPQHFFSLALPFHGPSRCWERRCRGAPFGSGPTRRSPSKLFRDRGRSWCTTIYHRIRPDSGDCVVSAAATAVTTWRVQNGSAAAEPDPCAAALELARLTINLGP